MMLLQELSTTPTRVLPENYGTLFLVSEIVVTIIVFVGVYYIFKPVFGKKPEDKEES